MFKTEAEFIDSARAAEDAYKKAGLGRTMGGDDAFTKYGVGVAWRVYSGVLEAFKKRGDKLEGLLIGGLTKDDDPVAQGAGIYPKLKGAFGIMNETTKEFGGSILDSKNWSILVNDSWVLGGVHTKRAFFLASPRIRANLYSGTALRVFGRELVGLNAFGYAVIAGTHPDLGEVMTCKGAASTAGFGKYQEVVEDALKTKSWEKLVKG